MICNTGWPAPCRSPSKLSEPITIFKVSINGQQEHSDPTAFTLSGSIFRASLLYFNARCSMCFTLELAYFTCHFWHCQFQSNHKQLHHEEIQALHWAPHPRPTSLQRGHFQSHECSITLGNEVHMEKSASQIERKTWCQDVKLHWLHGWKSDVRPYVVRLSDLVTVPEVSM